MLSPEAVAGLSGNSHQSAGRLLVTGPEYGFIFNEGDWPGSSWSLGLHGTLSPMKGTGWVTTRHWARMGLYHPWRGLARRLPKKQNTAGQDSPHGFPLFQAGFPLNRKVKFHNFSQRGLAFLSQHFQAAVRAGSLRVLARLWRHHPPPQPSPRFLEVCPLSRCLEERVGDRAGLTVASSMPRGPYWPEKPNSGFQALTPTPHPGQCCLQSQGLWTEY